MKSGGVMQICNKCKIDKPLEDFSINKQNRNGRKYRCRECLREDYISENKIEYFREYRKNNKTKILDINKRQDRTKARSRWKLATNIRNGSIVRPKKCPVCGSDKDIQGHHEDYLKPLEVDWICRSCHKHKHFVENQKSEQITKTL